VKLYPAIDILEGSAVRLVQGDFDARTVYDESPLSAALGWVSDGARHLHVVDLDGAKAGEPVNLEHLRRIVAESGVPVQYGGGLRTASSVARALEAGAERVIVGTAAVTNPDVLDEVLAEHDPDRIAVSVDVRDGRVATHGWLQTSETQARDVFAQLGERGVRNYVFTNIDHDGMLDGANRDEVIWAAREVREGSLVFSGGVGTIEHLRKLAELKTQENLTPLAGVIVGKALYEKRFTILQAHSVLGS
jgi:phosphoribosylformimino-5-aminoimidazole carboxamide ribotide isomerase